MVASATVSASPNASGGRARALLGDFDAMPARERNAARWVVLDEAARSLFADGWGNGSCRPGSPTTDATPAPEQPPPPRRVVRDAAIYAGYAVHDIYDIYAVYE
jgi:hypothetical protein